MDIIKKYEPLFGEWYAESLIGAGSFGRVYKIYREELGERLYAALKYISIPNDAAETQSLIDDGMSPDGITTYYRKLAYQLRDEIRLMAELKGNTNIVSYEDSRITPKTDGVGFDVFIRMELLEPLRSYAKRSPKSEHEAVRLGTDICSALTLCESANVIHRDIKPDNIFLNRNGSYKLGDFGIARRLEKTTAFMSKKGTYSYMAPEVYRGEPYGASCDIYSLGMVLYAYLNNGRLPFLPPSPQQLTPSDRETALSRRMRGEPLPAPCGAGPELSRVVLKACAFGPNDRYRNAEEMRRDLMRVNIEADEAAMLAAERIGAASSGYFGQKNGAAGHAGFEEEATKAAYMGVRPPLEANQPASPPKVSPTPEQPAPKTPVTPEIGEEHESSGRGGRKAIWIILGVVAALFGALCIFAAFMIKGCDDNEREKPKEYGEPLIEEAPDKAGGGYYVTLYGPKGTRFVYVNRANKRQVMEAGSGEQCRFYLSLKDVSPDEPIDGDVYLYYPKFYEITEDGEKPIEVGPIAVPVTHDSGPDSTPEASPGATPGASPEATQSAGAEVTISDPVLAAVLRERYGLTGTLHEADILDITELYLAGCGLTGLDDLAGFKNLKKLDISDNGIKDVSALSGLTRLEELHLCGNGIEDISSLAGLKNLTQLNLFENDIEDISVLSGMTKLKTLDIEENKVKDLTPLAGLTSLEYLYLNGNDITDVSPLAGLTKLVKLNISENDLSDISMLGGLTKLTAFFFSSNNIKDISVVRGMSRLEYIDANDNKISDVTPLHGLTNLKRANIYNNRLSEQKAEALRKALPGCKVNYW